MPVKIYALTGLLIHTYPRNCDLNTRKGNRLYEFLHYVLCVSLRTRRQQLLTISNEFHECKRDVKNTIEFQYGNYRACTKCCPEKILTTISQNNYIFNIANNAHYITENIYFIFAKHIYICFTKSLLHVSERTESSSVRTSCRWLKMFSFL